MNLVPPIDWESLWRYFQKKGVQYFRSPSEDVKKSLEGILYHNGVLMEDVFCQIVHRTFPTELSTS